MIVFYCINNSKDIKQNIVWSDDNHTIYESPTIKVETNQTKKITNNNDWRKNLAVEGTETENEDLLCLIKRNKSGTYSYFPVDRTEIYKLQNSRYNWQKILGPTNVKYPLTTKEKKELKFCDFKIYKTKNYDSFFSLKKLWENTGGFKGPNFISIKTLSKFVDKNLYAEIIKDNNTQIAENKTSQDLKGNELNKYKYDLQNTKTIPFLKISLKENIKDYNLKIPEKNITKNDQDNIITYYIFRKDFNSSKTIFDNKYLKFSSNNLNNLVPYQLVRFNTDKKGKIFGISAIIYYKKYEDNSFNQSEVGNCEKSRKQFINRNEIKFSSIDLTPSYIYFEDSKNKKYSYKDAFRKSLTGDFKSGFAITCSYTIKTKKKEVISDLQISTMTAEKHLEAWKSFKGIKISKFTGNDLINLTKNKDNKFSSYYEYLNYDYGFSSDKKIKVAKVEEPKQEEFKPKTNQDNEAPVIEIAEAITVNDTSYVLEGRVTDKADKIFVEIDGQPVQVKKGKFKVKRYSPVDEQIKIVAIDQWGNKSKTKLVNIIIDIDETIVAKKLEPLNPSNISNKSSTNKVALIIGIENYTEAPKANYANLDAKYFFDYARRAFGVKKQNINLLVNEEATVVKTDKAVSLWLKSKIKKNKSDLIIFFAGHGLASSDGKELYLLPQDGNPDRLERTALSRTDLFKEIISLNPKSVTMFLDTCYSGVSRDEQMLLASARPIRIVADDQDGIPENFTIFSASKLDQISSGLEEAKHGIFSYYLMKGLEGYADSNEDKKITNRELLAYMDENVSQKAAEQGREQNPSLAGDPDKVLVSYR